MLQDFTVYNVICILYLFHNNSLLNNRHAAIIIIKIRYFISYIIALIIRFFPNYETFILKNRVMT